MDDPAETSKVVPNQAMLVNRPLTGNEKLFGTRLNHGYPVYTH